MFVFDTVQTPPCSRLLQSFNDDILIHFEKFFTLEFSETSRIALIKEWHKIVQKKSKVIQIERHR